MKRRFRKLRKPAARKAYDNGETVILVGDNVNEFHILDGWHLGCRIAKNEFDNGSFDAHVAQFEFYLERELGRRAAYYQELA